MIYNFILGEKSRFLDNLVVSGEAKSEQALSPSPTYVAFSVISGPFDCCSLIHANLH